MAWTAAMPLAQLTDATPMGVRVGTTAIVLVRRGEVVHAVDALCPHKFGPMEDAHVEADCIVCPLHDGGFQLADGTPREGDGWAGELRVYPARVAGDQVEVDL